MAQRTRADDFLAPRAKVTSVAIAALVAAALAVSGCGGDSAEPQAASAPRSPAEETSASAPSSPSSSAAEEEEEQAKGNERSQGQSPEGTSKQVKGKQGQPIVLPKGSPEPGPTPSERAQATIADITLQSPALPADPSSAALPATHTCDGADSSPPLQWTGIPEGTEELALFAMNSQPVDEKLFFDWALVGIDPALAEIEAGKVPKGAIVGENSFGKTGYSICPPTGQAETYIFALYALPERLRAKRGFDPFTVRQQILAISGNVGLLAASYAR